MLPFIDLYVLVELTGHIGILNTLLVILATGIIGAEVVRREGLKVVRKMSSSVTAEEVSRNMLEGALLAIGGLMLITPGLITDLLGLVLVFGPTRQRIMLKIVGRFKNSSNVRFEVETF
ncbi:MAG: FxsA family protein [Nanohaloarchaea archaeon]|nr:FxsA family protein [Candidatus Nanohaloarchaea archaeon]